MDGPVGGPDLLKGRARYAEGRLETLSKQMDSLDSLRGLTNLCIYVTGSFGRLEASEYSDLDLFFIQSPVEGSESISRIGKTLLDADLIRLARELGFPEFSGVLVST